MSHPVYQTHYASLGDSSPHEGHCPGALDATVLYILVIGDFSLVSWSGTGRKQVREMMSGAKSCHGVQEGHLDRYEPENFENATDDAAKRATDTLEKHRIARGVLLG